MTKKGSWTELPIKTSIGKRMVMLMPKTARSRSSCGAVGLAGEMEGRTRLHFIKGAQYFEMKTLEVRSAWILKALHCRY